MERPGTKASDAPYPLFPALRLLMHVRIHVSHSVLYPLHAPPESGCHWRSEPGLSHIHIRALRVNAWCHGHLGRALHHQCCTSQFRLFCASTQTHSQQLLTFNPRSGTNKLQPFAFRALPHSPWGSNQVPFSANYATLLLSPSFEKLTIVGSCNFQVTVVKRSRPVANNGPKVSHVITNHRYFGVSRRPVLQTTIG